MKEEAIAIARLVTDPSQKLNLLREYLQACVLRSLHESEAFLCLSFVGGTALRFLFNLPRFSEDLDFSLEQPDGYDPARWMEKVKRDLSAEGFDVLVSLNERKTVHSAWVRIGEVLKLSGLSGMADQKLSIKLEVDTRPPSGAVTVTDIVRRHMTFAARHHDLPSLMAGKVHALITRSYGKGRDWYDLMWYRASRPPVDPNEVMLQNALDQTAGSGKHLAAEWRKDVLKRLNMLDQEALQNDAAPFLERPQDGALLSRAMFEKLLADHP